MIKRALTSVLRQTAKQYPVVTLTGPRQSGETTLVRAAFRRDEYASLEDPDRRAFALEDPRGFLGQVAGPVILDEVQRAAELFSYVWRNPQEPVQQRFGRTYMRQEVPAVYGPWCPIAGFPRGSITAEGAAGDSPRRTARIIFADNRALLSPPRGGSPCSSDSP